MSALLALQLIGAALPPGLRRRVEHLATRKDVQRLDSPCALVYQGQRSRGSFYSGPSGTCLLDGYLFESAHQRARLGLTNDDNDASVVAALLRAAAAEDSLRSLDGDFAGIYWQPGTPRALLFSDTFGSHPLAYRYWGGTLVAGSDASEVAAVASPRPPLDEFCLLSHLAFVHRPPTRTFFAGVERVEPAHCVAVGAHATRSSRYWQPEACPEASSLRLDQVDERFRELLARSVMHRCGDIDGVALLLSGGLDSTALACAMVPKIQPLCVTSSAPRHPELDEAEEARTQARHIGIHRHTAIAVDELNPLRTLQAFRPSAHPPFGPNDFMGERLVQTASRSARLVVLGSGGESVVPAGDTVFLEHVAERRWMALASEFRILGNPMRRMAGIARRAWFGYATNRRSLPAFVRPEQRARLAPWHATVEAMLHPRPSDREQHRLSLLHPINAEMLELLSSLGRRHQCELSAPFLDRTLANFCLGLPWWHKRFRAWKRVVLRRAYATQRAPGTSWCLSKKYYDPVVDRAMRRACSPDFEGFFEEALRPLEQFVDRAKLRRLYRVHLVRYDSLASLYLWRAIGLGYWISSQSQ